MSVTIQRTDALALLRSLPPESVDLLLTDPAYESLEKHRARGTTTRLKQSEASSNEWFEIFPNSGYLEFFELAYRALRPCRHAYVLCDDETSDVVKIAAQAAGFYVWNTLIWVKGRETGPDTDPKVEIGMGYHYRRCSERIVFLEKRSKRFNFELGRLCIPEHHVADAPLFGARPLPPGTGRQLRNKGIAEVLFYPAVRNGYPTEKPVPMLSLLITQSTEPGETVLDPFAGSGSTGQAAMDTGRSAILGDISERAIAHMTERLEVGDGTA